MHLIGEQKQKKNLLNRIVGHYFIFVNVFCDETHRTHTQHRPNWVIFLFIFFNFVIIFSINIARTIYTLFQKQNKICFGFVQNTHWR